MQISRYFIVSLLSLTLFIAPAQAGLIYNYSQLALKDLDQMTKIVKEKIKESKQSGGDKVIALKEGLQAVYTRPNEDFLIEKIVSPLKNALDELDAYEDAVTQLVREATGALGNPKAFKPVAQVSYAIFLDNLMSEMRPNIHEKFENSIFTMIKAAKLKNTKEAINERDLRMMKIRPSPSEIAEAALDEAAVEIKEKREKEEKEAKEPKLPEVRLYDEKPTPSATPTTK